MLFRPVLAKVVQSLRCVRQVQWSLRRTILSDAHREAAAEAQRRRFGRRFLRGVKILRATSTAVRVQAGRWAHRIEDAADEYGLKQGATVRRRAPRPVRPRTGGTTGRRVLSRWRPLPSDSG